MNGNRRRQLRLKTRRERLRREKHERRSRPKLERKPGPEEPRVDLPSPYVQERMLLGINEVMEEKEFSSDEEMKAYLDTLMGHGLEQALQDKPRSAKQQAQEFAFQALEVESRPRRLQLARQALALDPDCVDALNALAHATATSRRDLIAKLTRAVAVGERTLGTDFFEEHGGSFWVITSTRPYMRARFDLVCELLIADRHSEAIYHMEALLELNPNDNQGVRDFLFGAYFSVDDLAGARQLLARFEGDASAIHMWGRVLERCLSGDFEEASRAFEEAREWNSHVPGYLTGRRRLPRAMLDHYTKRGESEAIYCVTILGSAWQRHPEALAWLKSKDASLCAASAG
jgi:tetratricopeptide (TPR) repeat protein